MFDFPAMQGAILPRGPDAAGEFQDNFAHIVHSRLAIIDPTTASAQPFSSERWVLAYNGEIFNFRDLRKQLEQEGAVFTSRGDTEVLFQAIDRWGVLRALREVCGMFAFAAYDKLHRELWIARDRLGIKPLYITSDSEFVACASWPSALLRGIRKDWKLDRTGLHRLMQLGAVYGGASLVEGVAEFPPAEAWRVSLDLKVERHRYWTASTQPKKFDLQDFSSLFETVVAQHLEADVPSSVFLSGGVDSTALAAGMQGGLAFHLDSPEREYAEEAAAVCGLDFICASANGELSWSTAATEFALATGTVFAALKQPFTVSRAVSKAGLKMALSGNAADEIFLGYNRTPTLRLSEDTIRGIPPFETAPQTDFEVQVRHMFTSGANLESEVTKGKDSAERDKDLLDACRAHLASCTERVGADAAFRLFELEAFVQPDVNTNLDHASMFWGVEMRVPFLDHRIVEYALSLSGAELIDGEYGRKKPLKRYLLSKGIPERIWHRKKVGFSIPMALNAYFRDDLLTSLIHLRDEDFFNFLPVRGIFGRDYVRTAESAFAFHAWKRAWIDSGIVRV